MGNEETYENNTQAITDKYGELVKMLREGSFKNITFITGAGISTSAGIPDFRSNTGIFSQVKDKYGYKSPMSLFILNSFYKNPHPFYDFCKHFDIDNCKPTTTHLFLGFLCHKNYVRRIFTQNVDGLELKAGIPKDKVVFAHGTITEAHCPYCGKYVDINVMKQHVMNESILYCGECNHPCKPKVVFYGEELPDSFGEKYNDIRESDLSFIIGTSLKVYPFGNLPYDVPVTSWRVLINREKVGSIFSKNPFQFSNEFRRDIFLEGNADEIISQLIKDCNWEEEFNEYSKQYI